LPALVVKAPTAKVLVKLPPLLATTLTMKVQPPDGMLLPLASVILVSPGVAVTPRHVPTLLAGLATVTPLGRLSTKALLSVMALALLLPMEIVSALLTPGEIGPALAKVLAKVGTFKLTTVNDAFATAPLPPLPDVMVLVVLA
jgi:hypothetical protein